MIAKDTKNYTGIIMNFRNESEKLPIYEDNQERGRKISIVGSIKGGNLKSHQNTQGLLTQIKSNIDFAASNEKFDFYDRIVFS